MSENPYTPPTSDVLNKTPTHDVSHEEDYNMIDWTKKCLTNYVNFEGRARRKEYWYFVLATTILGLISQGIDLGLGTTPMFNGALSLATLLPSLAVTVRRLHDTGRSGWWYLLVFTIIGIIPIIIWLATDTHQEDNEYGPPAYYK